MLYLQICLNEDRYVVSTKHIVTITPLLKMHKIPHAPPYIAGLLNYHGQSVPVIDLNKLISNKNCKKRLSTRIILLNVFSENKKRKMVGLQAERVTEVVKLADDCFQASGICNHSARYLGDITNDNEGLLQVINVNQLLNEDLEKLLFQ